MLLEEFKSCVSEHITVYLNEQKVSTLQQAATLADEFALTHKSPREGFQKSGSQLSGAAVSSTSKADRQCFYCHKSGHLIADCVAWKHKQGPVAMPSKGMGLIKTSISD